MISSLPLAAFGDFGNTLLLVFGAFGVGGMIVEAIKNHNRTRLKMAELKAKQGSEAVQQELTVMREEMSALKQQVTTLRDTTTEYDLSFDAALQRMEQRVGRIEQNQQEQSQQRIGLS